jgi:hypothetical protein
VLWSSSRASRSGALTTGVGLGGERRRTLPLDSGEEVCFVVGQDDLLALKDVRVLEQILQQVLQRKVWVLPSVGDKTVPFA